MIADAIPLLLALVAWSLRAPGPEGPDRWRDLVHDAGRALLIVVTLLGALALVLVFAFVLVEAVTR